TLRTRAGPPTASPPRRLDSATYSHSGKRPRPDAAHQGSELAGTHHSGEQEGVLGHPRYGGRDPIRMRCTVRAVRVAGPKGSDEAVPVMMHKRDARLLS
ncbi:hypothetical protein GOODEAATRI_011752, partial [Goodea atripinnis]